MRPLGKRQIALLRVLGNPSNAMVGGDRRSAGLVARGLCAAEPDGSFVRITPAGLYVLAELLAAEQIGFDKDRAARKAASATSSPEQ